MDDKIPSPGGVGSDHIKHPIVIPDSRGIDPPGRGTACKDQLFIPGKTVINQFPIGKVFAVVDRNAREELKGGSNKIIILSHTAYTRIGMKTGNNRIAKGIHTSQPPKKGI
jgi:hypothetical protein